MSQKSTGAVPKATRSLSQAESIKKSHWIFGVGCEFYKFNLPTELDVIRNFLFKKNALNKERLSPSDKTSIYKEIAQDLISIWNRAGIPFSTENGIVTKIERIFTSKKYESIQKTKSRYENDEKHKLSILTHYDKLFDLSLCQCYKNAENEADMNPSFCKCQEINKISKSDLSFYLDQKQERKLTISYAKDMKESQRKKALSEQEQRRNERQISAEKYRMKSLGNAATDTVTFE